MSSAKYVGRVGALAVFLGVGAALAMPTAQADTGGSAHSSGSGSSSHSASAKKSPGSANHRAQGKSARVAIASTSSRVTAVHRTIGSSGRSGANDPGTPVTSPADLAAVAYTRRRPVALQQRAEVTTAVTLTNEVSPLGTQQQISREQLAMQAVNTLPVKLMKIILRQGFLAAANKQFALVGGPDAANLAALDNAVDEYALASAFSEQILNPMNPAVVTQVAPPHSWYGVDVGGSRLLYDNPDTIYRFIPVNKTSDYVITGRFYDEIPADTTFSVLEGSSGKTSTILSLSDIDVSDDGSFVITVNGDPAAPGEKNHLQLTSSSTLVAVRNTLGDWNTEEPMDLAVHKVGGPPNSLFAQLGGFLFFGSVVNDNPVLANLVSLVPPLPIADAPIVRGTLTALLMVIRGANQEAKYMALATTDPETGMPRQPNTMTQPASNAEFLANQLQSNGYFQLADDEALVLTIDPGNAGFVSIPVYNDWTITDDYWNELTSLNSDQAVRNDDGTYTVVISPTDPLVANWISTGGLNQGIISMRFQDLNTDDPAQPGVQAEVVKLSELTHDTNGTAVITQAQRDEQLTLRKAGFDKRWAPYPQA
ncbi:DUF1214 domain-containing protein [Mycobacterium pinniadriaticum]|uniref:DUF1214 domain-containing protein n=1 Tax=Mycobacterium pinniadriaticum TaxID=2994102 RepID=UPI002B05953C|nr:DUF1214 domain-containing protein [Mycobacterium pinniadriaticum]